MKGTMVTSGFCVVLRRSLGCDRSGGHFRIRSRKEYPKTTVVHRFDGNLRSPPHEILCL